MPHANRCLICGHKIQETRHGWVHRSRNARLRGHLATPFPDDTPPEPNPQESPR